MDRIGCQGRLSLFLSELVLLVDELGNVHEIWSVNVEDVVR